MPQVKLKENEPFDVALRRFKRSCEKAGVLAEVRRREFYEKPTACVSAKQLLPLSATRRSYSAKTRRLSAFTRQALRLDKRLY